MVANDNTINHWKVRMVMTVPDKVDPIKTLQKLKTEKKVIQAHIKGHDDMVVYYDNRRITEAEILKATKCILNTN